MSSDRANNRLLKPTLASNRTARTPSAPRIGATPTPPLTARAAAPRLATRTPVASPRISSQDDGNMKDTVGNSNITPRSAARILRAESAHGSTPPEDSLSSARPKLLMTSSSAPLERAGPVGGLSVHSGSSGFSRSSRPTSLVGENAPAKASPMLPKSAGYLDARRSAPDDAGDSRFFHASDVQKQESIIKRPEPKKASTFFYADGNEDRAPSPRAPSPVLSAVSGKYSTGPKMRSESSLTTTKNPPLLSPALSSIAASSPYFAVATASLPQKRSPSPSKENIHLSYRKGASQIFGLRPTTRSTVSLASELPTVRTTASLSTAGQQRPGFSGAHRKSSSVSSIDSGNSYQARRRSATVVDLATALSSETEEQIPELPTNGPWLKSPPIPLPTIDTSLASPSDLRFQPEGALSPTKAISELAAEARRERKVLDLEISNSSLLAINASLEREIRRQKAELKRFRRLSRAGRFSLGTDERSARFSEGLTTLGEDNGDDDGDMTANDSMPEFAEDYSDTDDDGSLVSECEPLSPGLETQRNRDQLAKDEKRLRVDLTRHKELLVQSQMMNQSIKRCMYATEEMIREGKKALQYHVRVSDVKLGGRVLTGHEDEDDRVEIEIVDDDDPLSHAQESMESANALLDVWKGVGRPFFEGSEGSGDRDSGIEVDKPMSHVSHRQSDQLHPPADQSGRLEDLEASLMKLDVALE